MNHETREGWLVAAKNKLAAEFFTDDAHKLPETVRVSCGFPKGHAKAIGQCWSPESCEDGSIQIFICPSQHNPLRILDILLHELIHACVGNECGHKGEFKKMAREFDLKGKLTATYAEEGTELHSKLQAIASTLGKYPHAPMIKRPKSTKKSMGGWVRMVSPEDERYKVVISPKMLEECGAPLDPWGNEMEEVVK